MVAAIPERPETAKCPETPEAGARRHRVNRPKTSLLHLLAGGALLLAGSAAMPQSGKLGAIPAKPLPSSEHDRWVPARSGNPRCIDVATIAGAMVVDHHNLDVIMRGGRRYRLTLAQACPQLGYYGGFYYQPSEAGKFCAGRDRLMARAGGSCRVSRISLLQKVPPPRPRSRH